MQLARQWINWQLDSQGLPINSIPLVAKQGVLIIVTLRTEKTNFELAKYSIKFNHSKISTGNDVLYNIQAAYRFKMFNHFFSLISLKSQAFDTQRLNRRFSAGPICLVLLYNSHLCLLSKNGNVKFKVGNSIAKRQQAMGNRQWATRRQWQP